MIRLLALRILKCQELRMETECQIAVRPLKQTSQIEIYAN